MKEEKQVEKPTNARELAHNKMLEARAAAKQARIISVGEEIRIAKEAREQKEKEDGFVESPTVKAEREKEEKKKIEEANKDRLIEHVVGGSGNALIDQIITALNQVINHINGDETYVEPVKFKVTDTLYYNETGRTDIPRTGESKSAVDTK